MKKIVLLLLLLTSLYADSKIYLGLGYGVYKENLTKADKTEASVTPDMLIFKAGYGDRQAYAIEFTVDYINNKDPLFHANDGIKYGLNVELLKAFDFGIYVLPFAKVGLGAGTLKTDLNEGNFNYGSFNAGFGMFIPYNEHLDLEVGYNYRHLTYEKQNKKQNEKQNDASVSDFIPSAHVNLIYIGINTRF